MGSGQTVTVAPGSHHGTVFVSIAAYRDPDLVPTIDDCLAKARHPERLRFGICWQHGPEEQLPRRLTPPRFRIIDTDWRESRGACWARAEVMGLYDGEDWYLQLDSHHRFTSDWDVKLLEQAQLSGSALPLLSTYAAAFSPGETGPLRECATRIDFGCFTREGVVLTAPGTFGDGLTRPLRARFISGHFLFAPGRFVDDVPYDPELYFIGEEITLAVRAFTCGYDLLHPTRHILWHEYTRAYRTRHWDDHTQRDDAHPAWHERDAASLAKVARFLIEPHIGRYGLGTARTFADYEAYAGIDFATRRVQDYTRLHLEPPNPATDADWAARVRDHKLEITVGRDEVPAAAFDDPSFWYVAVHDADGRELYRRDADARELRSALAGGARQVSLSREFASEAAPVTWTVIPHSTSAGWLERVTGPVPATQRIFVAIASYRDPDLVATLDDCVAKASHPERVRFGIAWQHGPEEQLPPRFVPPQFRILDIDWRESRGQAWARAQAMSLYTGEEWYLQLDAHHRFTENWDAKLIEQASLTGSAKPLISAPAPLDVNAPSGAQTLWRLEFTSFRPDGIPEMCVGILPGAAAGGRPVPARFVCAHFLFAPGHFVEDVPYNPDLYFSNIEITIAIRAFTHGYDLYHPGRAILWHDCVPAQRRKHWDDHTPASGVQRPWSERYVDSIGHVARFLAAPSVGRYALGSQRSFADYEDYAGISFAHRCAQDYTLLHGTPPNPPVDPSWPQRVKARRIEIEIDRGRLSPATTEEAAFWYVGIQDRTGRELHRRDVTGDELRGLLAGPERKIVLVREFASEATPASWRVIPYSASSGWLEPLGGAAATASAA